MADDVAPKANAAVQIGGNDKQAPLARKPSSIFDTPTLAKSGKLVVEWYLSFFAALSTLGTLGAGFTLSVVVLSPPRETNLKFKAFSPKAVSVFAAVSSILFVLTVLVSQGCAQVFRFEQTTIADGVDNDEALVLWSLAALSLLLQVQVLGAFLFLELVLTAHEPVVGFVGIGLTAGLGAVALGLWAMQATGRKPVARYRRLAHARKRRVSSERKEGP